jgi:hypothetical protein
MRAATLFPTASLALAAALSAQQGKPPKLNGPVIPATAHIHPLAQCKGSPDGIYMKSGNTYFACIGEKDVCSKEKGKIPAAMITEFDQESAAFQARMAAFKTSSASRPTPSERLAEMRARREAFGGRSANPAATQVPVEAPAAYEDATPPTPKLTSGQVAEIAVGMPEPEVRKRLGEPYSRISGEYPSVTYLLENGGSARIEFEDGKAARIHIR